MNEQFKVGDIVEILPSRYTTALVVSVERSPYAPYKMHGKCIPLFGTFPIGSFLYPIDKDEWHVIDSTNCAEYRTNIFLEAKNALKETWKQHAIDNLTYIELLSILNERSKSQ